MISLMIHVQCEFLNKYTVFTVNVVNTVIPVSLETTGSPVFSVLRMRYGSARISNGRGHVHKRAQLNIIIMKVVRSRTWPINTH